MAILFVLIFQKQVNSSGAGRVCTTTTKSSSSTCEAGRQAQLTKSLDFSESAEEIRVDIEAGQPILRAMLRTENGEFEARDLNLTERISNRDGQLCFGKYWYLLISNTRWLTKG